MAQYIIVNETHGPYAALGALLLKRGERERAQEYLNMLYICGEEPHTYSTFPLAVEACEQMREEFNNDQLVVYRCERVDGEEYQRILELLDRSATLVLKPC